MTQMRIKEYKALNKDSSLRNKILDPYFKAYTRWLRSRGLGDLHEWFGGVRYFKLMPVEMLKKLVSLGFAELDDAQGCAPSIGQIIKFMERWPKFVLAHGYAVSHERDDYRIAVEGVEGIIPKDFMSPPGEEAEVDFDAHLKLNDFKTDFLRLWIQADELELNNDGHFRVWYD